jgi:hypothetical protein
MADNKAIQHKLYRAKMMFAEFRKYKWSYEETLREVADFFHVSDKRISEYMASDTPLEVYPHCDIDVEWVALRVQKHLESLKPQKDKKQKRPNGHHTQKSLFS